MDDQEFYRRYYAALERACMEASDGGTLLYGMLQNGDEAEAFLSRFEATAAKIAKEAEDPDLDYGDKGENV